MNKFSIKEKRYVENFLIAKKRPLFPQPLGSGHGQNFSTKIFSSDFDNFDRLIIFHLYTGL
jgi:hypothetical protein